MDAIHFMELGNYTKNTNLKITYKGLIKLLDSVLSNKLLPV